MHYFRGNGFAFPLNTRTYIMGILNVTPDSFFDGGKWNTPQVALNHALEMEQNGTDLLDIGAQSTRPGHTPLSDTEELEVLKQYLPFLANRVQIPISVDTFYPWRSTRSETAPGLLTMSAADFLPKWLRL